MTQLFLSRTNVENKHSVCSLLFEEWGEGERQSSILVGSKLANRRQEARICILVRRFLLDDHVTFCVFPQDILFSVTPSSSETNVVG